jgi:hypothetical protein
MKLTDWFLILWILTAVAYDVWAVLTLGVSETISYRLRVWVAYCPWLLLSMGCLLWHLWGGPISPDGR